MKVISIVMNQNQSNVGNATNMALCLSALFIVACGTGGIKPCVSTLGGDQFDETTENGQKETVWSFKITDIWQIGMKIVIILFFHFSKVQVLAYFFYQNDSSFGRFLNFKFADVNALLIFKDKPADLYLWSWSFLSKFTGYSKIGQFLGCERGKILKKLEKYFKILKNQSENFQSLKIQILLYKNLLKIF